MISLVKVRSESQQDVLDQKLLIVDDEPLMRSGLRHHLELEGRTVFECGTSPLSITFF